MWVPISLPDLPKLAAKNVDGSPEDNRPPGQWVVTRSMVSSAVLNDPALRSWVDNLFDDPAETSRVSNLPSLLQVLHREDHRHLLPRIRDHLSPPPVLTRTMLRGLRDLENIKDEQAYRARLVELRGPVDRLSEY